MRSPRSALLLVPVLLAGAMPARAQPPTCQAGAPRVELSAAKAAPAELCIHPGRPTTFVFDSPLVVSAVRLDGREHFREVVPSKTALLLVPLKQLPPGARLGLEVRFEDDQGPQSARFTLVAHPEQAAHSVDVVRQVVRAKPAASDSTAELLRLKGELQQCVQQLDKPSPPSSPALYLALVLERGKMDETGLTVHAYKAKDFSQSPGGGLTVRGFSFYRTRAVLALQVRLTNEDPGKPWTLEGATLLGRNGEVLQTLAVHPRTPLAPGATELRWVEWPMVPPGAEKSYTLQLWEAGKARTATVPGLKLP